MNKRNSLLLLLIGVILINGCIKNIENKYKIEPELSCIYINKEILYQTGSYIGIMNECDKGFSFDNCSIPWSSSNKTVDIRYYFDYFDYSDNLRKACSCHLKYSPDYNTICFVEDFPQNYCPKNQYCLSSYECKNIILPNADNNMMSFHVFSSGKWYLISNELKITGEVIYP